MKIFDHKLDPEIINSPLFKEDSVREEIITPILRALGYSTFGSNKIIRSKTLDHPYIYFGTKKEHIKMIPDYLIQVNGVNKFILDAKAPSEKVRIQNKLTVTQYIERYRLPYMHYVME